MKPKSRTKNYTIQKNKGEKVHPISREEKKTLWEKKVIE